MNIDMNRYSRQILFAPIGPSGQEKLGRARVAIVGLGALGTALANHMARAGVGMLRLIDRDFVEESNLQRQMLFDEADAQNFMPKAVAAERKLRAINSTLTLEAHVTDLTWKNAESLLSGVDLILDGSDNFQVRYLVNDFSVKHGVPWIYGGAVSARGMSYTIRPGVTPCLRCLFPDAPAPGTTETCDTAGVIGPIIHVIAAYQATEALKLLCGAEEALETRMRHIDLWHNQAQALQVSAQKNDQCPCCAKRQWDYLDPVEKEAQEISMCGRQSVQISLGQVKLDLDSLAERLRHVGETERNPFMLRVQIDEQHRLAVFPDGRILVQGTTDTALAKNLVAKYIGF
ncbi:adenylyltransferase and sulfurtransferase [Laceyella tengchongensis]|uniref:Adenylyltransferase and sulfurtransferase n=1 Tax=Laceyella tengchongensis TaxID=574699 RepID=A0AA45WS57_9BACL|nr:adenylyltransferase and sulfurtransferase [Laceyella tengchongensis]